MARAGFSHYQSYTTQKNNRKKLFRFLRWGLFIYLAFLLIQGTFIHTLRIDNASMTPTLAPGTALIMSPLPLGANLPFLPFGFPGWRAPERGEVVEIEPPYHQDAGGPVGTVDDLVRFLTFGFISVDQSTRKSWDTSRSLRRVIGLPGDKIKVDDFVAMVTAKGQEYPLSEFELSKRIYNIQKGQLPAGWTKNYPFSGAMEEITLGEDEYFVLADNRGGAGDSRTWGVVKRSAFKSSAILKYWPFSAFGGL